MVKLQVVKTFYKCSIHQIIFEAGIVAFHLYALFGVVHHLRK